MTGNYEKTLQKLELAEEKLKKASQKKKDLEAEKKTLLERAETERTDPVIGNISNFV